MNRKNFSPHLYFIASLVAAAIIHSLFVFQSSTQQSSAPSGAFDALQFFTAQRIFPGENYPDDAYTKEYEKMKLNFSENLREQKWTNIGMTNCGGRTLAIAINPTDTSIIWAGSASGGLWKSISGGLGANAWKYIDIGFPNLSVSSIAIDPFNANIILIGTGEVYNYQNTHMGVSIRSTRGFYGMGAFKSTDGGATWNKSIDWSYQLNRGVWDFAFDPMNENIVYAATTEGILKSTNKGDSWMFVSTMKMVMDLAIDYHEPNIIFAGVGNLGSANPGVYRSIDSGNTWQRLTNGLPTTHTGRTTVTCYKKNPKIVMASIGNDFSTRGLFRSTDGGYSWSEMSGVSLDYLSYQGFYAEGVLMKDDDSSQVVVSGVNFYKSTTGGSNLVQKDVGGSSGSLHVDHHDIVANPLNPNKIFIACDGGVFRSNNFGESFFDCNNGYVTSQFYAGFSNSKTDSMLALGGLQDNGSWQFNGTSTWNYKTGGDGIFTAINPSSDNYQYTSSQYLKIYRSTNRGSSFSSVVGSFSSSIVNFVAPFVIAPSTPGILYAGKKNIMKSTDYGATWSDVGGNLDGNKIIAIAVSNSDPNLIYASTVPTSIRAGIFKSTNGGLTWANITRNLPNKYPMDIALNPNNHNEAYVVFSGFGTSHIFRSDNGGDSWVDLQKFLPDVPFQSVAVDPFNTNIVYAGCDFGLFASTDKGTNWFSFNNGMNDATIVTDITFSIKNKKVRASTHGNGVYQTDMLSNTISSAEENSFPEKFVLYQNFPNPFNPKTTIKYAIPKTDFVNISLHTILGDKIADLVDEVQQQGIYSINLHSYNLSSGIYFYKMKTGSGYTSTKKLIIIK